MMTIASLVILYIATRAVKHMVRVQKQEAVLAVLEREQRKEQARMVR